MKQVAANCTKCGTPIERQSLLRPVCFDCKMARIRAAARTRKARLCIERAAQRMTPDAPRKARSLSALANAGPLASLMED